MMINLSVHSKMKYISCHSTKSSSPLSNKSVLTVHFLHSQHSFVFKGLSERIKGLQIRAAFSLCFLDEDGTENFMEPLVRQNFSVLGAINLVNFNITSPAGP
jgi:hypothetical protein